MPPSACLFLSLTLLLQSAPAKGDADLEDDVALMQLDLHRQRGALLDTLRGPEPSKSKEHDHSPVKAEHHDHAASQSPRRAEHQDNVADHSQSKADAESPDAPHSGGHGKHEDPFRSYNVSIACMLLGNVFFVMLLLYLVNWNDQDIRRYAWGTISVTLSIFVSLLMFSGVNVCLLDVVHAWTRNEYMLVLFQYSHFVFWVIVLQFVLAFCSGGFFEGDEPPKALFATSWVINDAMRYDHEAPVCDATVRTTRKGVTRSVAIVDGLEVPVVRRKIELHARKRNLKCWGMILGHMAAFADIRAGHQLQDMAIFKASPWFSLVPILLNFVFVWMLYMSVDRIREAEKARRLLLGKSSKYSRIDMFDSAAEESENEVLSLSSSYLIYNTIVFFITGALPSAEPELRAEALKGEEIDPRRIWYLLAAGVFAALLTGVLHWLGQSEEAFEDEEEANEDEPPQAGCRRSSLKLLQKGMTIEEIMARNEEPILIRCMEVLTVTSAFTFAWCVREALTWRFRMSATLQDTPLAITTMGGKVLVSFVVSLGAFVVIFLLDKIDDAYRQEEGCDESSKLIVAIINSVAILVGLSWEESFDFGVEELSTSLPHAHAWELAGALAVGVVIVPAWAKYILKKSMLLDEYYQKQLAASAAHSSEDGPAAISSCLATDAASEAQLHSAARSDSS